MTGQAMEITALGAVSAVGKSVDQTCASIRAGVNLFGEYPYYWGIAGDPDWGDEEPIVVSRVPLLPDASSGRSRLLKLGTLALLDMFSRSKLKRTDIPRTALLVALPMVDEVVETWDLESSFADELCHETGLGKINRQESSAAGHCAAFHLLKRAQELLTESALDQCVLLCVDSLLDLDRLEHLDKAYRIKSERGVDGYIPGEAAVALLLSAPGKGEPLARIGAIGEGTEPNPLGSDKASTAEGLRSAISAALAPLRAEQLPSWVLCDLNGETYRSFEWGLVRTRLGEDLPDVQDLLHPVDSVGEIGAATGGILLAAAAQALAEGYAPSDTALLWTASDDERRAATYLQKPA